MKATRFFASISRSFLFATLAFASLAVTGCGDDDPASPDTTTPVVPKSGSIYNYTLIE